MDCPDSCSLIVAEGADGTVRIRGNPNHPFTSGFVCAKIKKYPQRLQHKSRIVHPMIRNGDKWLTIGWNDALDLCARKIGKLRNEPSAILHFHGEGAKGVLKQANKLFFALLGARRTKGSLCDAAGFIACLSDFGSRYNNDIETLVYAGRIINWGKDLSRSSVHTAAIIRKASRQGAKVLTISPGGDGNESFSDAFVRIRPGTDRFLAAAVIRLLMERGAIDDDILNHANNVDEFYRVIREHPLKTFALACDVKLKDVERVFDYYTSTGSAATLIGAGLQRYRYGGENVRFINALAFLSGNIGCPGGGSYFHLHALTNLDYDWAKGPVNKRRPTLFMAEIARSIAEAENPPVKMIWVNGSNLINQAPNSGWTADVFHRIPFKVVVDAFMTDTAQRADLFLPTALMLEQEDIVGSYLHNYIHYVSPVLHPPGEARTDYWILSELGKRLSPAVLLPEKDACFRASLDLPCLEISLEELKQQKFAKAKRPPTAYAGLKFDNPDGKYRLPTGLHQERKHPPGFPLRLLSLIRKDAMHSQLLPEDQKIPVDLWVSPDSSALNGLNPGQDVWLVSPTGRIRVRLRTLKGLHPETVVTRRGGWMKLGGGVNRIVEAELSDIGNGAPFYEQYVRLEKL